MARGVNLETVHSVGVTRRVVRVAAEPAVNDVAARFVPCVAPTGGVCPSGVVRPLATPRKEHGADWSHS